MFGLSELAIILLVVIAVLCAKKLPELARSAGKSARILKAEARAMKDEDEPAAAPRVIQGETAQSAGTATPDESKPEGTQQPRQ
ncbi:twin-arginine translocase TatA/TatE family subunit [Streptomyces regalis]|uniref:Sec-independent protein translocase protein TatA n=1 Tax=Streptomyces regalis TaxID=68262 RepID=A0A0X3VRG7_9ACTN|nr:twin-arginine translocase TatA/TatE family subunit [Streptomyces regalis]KUL46882.1 hypothetical protein ADL12_00040 [Streptomyces regalis]